MGVSGIVTGMSRRWVKRTCITAGCSKSDRDAQQCDGGASQCDGGASQCDGGASQCDGGEGMIVCRWWAARGHKN